MSRDFKSTPQQHTSVGFQYALRSEVLDVFRSYFEAGCSPDAHQLWQGVATLMFEIIDGLEAGTLTLDEAALQLQSVSQWLSGVAIAPPGLDDPSQN